MFHIVVLLAMSENTLLLPIKWNRKNAWGLTSNRFLFTDDKGRSINRDAR